MTVTPAIQLLAMSQQLDRICRKPSNASIGSLDPLSDADRAAVNGIVIEAKLLIDQELGAANQFSPALLLAGANRHAKPLDVVEILNRAVKYFPDVPVGPLNAASAPMRKVPQPAELFARLQALVKDMPELAGRGQHLVETVQWLSRTSEVMRLTGAGAEAAVLNQLPVSSQPETRRHFASSVQAAVFRVLARLEMEAPAAAQGAFIAVKSPFDAHESLRKILGTAKASVLVIDPYFDGTAFSMVVPLIDPKVKVELLGDAGTKQPNLSPALSAYRGQYPGAIVEVRLTAPRLLHDRLIIVDDRLVWNVSQSIKDLAGRSPASIEKSEGDIAERKVQAYRSLWDRATPVI